MQIPEEIKKGLECCHQESETTSICRKCPYSNIDDGCRVIMADALAYINQLEQRLASVGKMCPEWISVHDMEPADNTMAVVLARNTENCGFSKFIIAAFINGEWLCVQPEWYVTHWMPIPEMPKEE